MYLTCPNCETVYTVRAAMLREGQGEVRCGACHTLFNALDYLSDELPPSCAPEPQPDMPYEPEHEPEPTAPESPAPPDTPSIADPPPPEQALPPLRVSDNERVPEVLARDWQVAEASRKARSRNVLLGFVAVALLVALAAQYLWFAPRDLVARFPQTAQLVDRFCHFTGCLAPPQRDLSRVQVLSREVRAHPRYEGALLVSATFSNAAPWPQPYPRLRFRLYDVNGQTIASRTFAPDEYLDVAPQPGAKMEPGRPLQVGLEMLAPEEASVSFEFSFL